MQMRSVGRGKAGRTECPFRAQWETLGLGGSWQISADTMTSLMSLNVVHCRMAPTATAIVTVRVGMAVFEALGGYGYHGNME